MADSLRVVLDSKGERVLQSLTQADLVSTLGAVAKIGISHRAHIKRRFLAGTGSGDQAWPPLEDRTIKAKIFQFGENRGTLRVTDRLMRSFTEISHPDNINRLKNDVYETGSKVPYARFHFTGLPNRVVVSQGQAAFLRSIGFHEKRIGSPIPLPKRDPSDPEPEQIDKYKGILEKEIKKNFVSAGIGVS